LKPTPVRNPKVLTQPYYESVLWIYRLVWASGAFGLYFAVASSLLFGVGLPWWVVVAYMTLSHPGLRALTMMAANLFERDFHRRFQSFDDWWDEFAS